MLMDVFLTPGLYLADSYSTGIVRDTPVDRPSRRAPPTPRRVAILWERTELRGVPVKGALRSCTEGVQRVGNRLRRPRHRRRAHLRVGGVAFLGTAHTVCTTHTPRRPSDRFPLPPSPCHHQRIRIRTGEIFESPRRETKTHWKRWLSSTFLELHTVFCVHVLSLFSRLRFHV